MAASGMQEEEAPQEPGRLDLEGLARDPMDVATQVMAPQTHKEEEAREEPGRLDLEGLARDPMDVATQVMAPMDPPAQGELATQVMASMECSAQVMAPPESRPEAAASPMELGHQRPGPPCEEPAEPAAPREVKRPMTAFWLFQEEVRNEVREEIGSKAAGSVTKEIAARWKSMDEPAKAKYTEKACELREQFYKDLASGAVQARSPRKIRAEKAKKAVTAKGSKAGRRSRMLKLLKRRQAPKKPKSSYSIWLTENRARVRAKLVGEGMVEPTFEEIAKAAGKTWLALPDAEKAPYAERSQHLWSKYKEINMACKEYKKANVKDTRGTSKAKALAKKKKAAAKAKKEAAAGSKTKKRTADNAKQQSTAADKGKSVVTPKKQPLGTSRPTPNKAKRAAAEATVYLDMDVVSEAQKAGMEGTFRRLAEREDMKPYPQRALLEALVASKGLLHRAKDAILAGGP